MSPSPRYWRDRLAAGLRSKQPHPTGGQFADARDGPLTPEIRDLFMNRRTLSVLAIDIAWFFVIIFDMVIKPFS